MQFLRKAVDPGGFRLVTDEYLAYNAVSSFVAHATVNHSVM